MEELLPILESPPKTAQKFWLALEPENEIAKNARDWLRQSQARNLKHVAIHVRRGDHMYFNHYTELFGRERTDEVKQRVSKSWSDADTEVEVLHMIKHPTTRELHRCWKQQR